MTNANQLAVEIRKGADHLDIWVDANNNGQRDDDDVNIFVTANGGFYTVSPTFKNKLDTTIQAGIKELAMAMLGNSPAFDNSMNESKLRDLALKLVVKATSGDEQPATDDAPIADSSDAIEAMKKNLRSFF